LNIQRLTEKFAANADRIEALVAANSDLVRKDIELVRKDIDLVKKDIDLVKKDIEAKVELSKKDSEVIAVKKSMRRQWIDF
jgi:uncharacterized protein YktB (UPF0637 family)